MSTKKIPNVPTSDEFISTLGRATWVLSQSKLHKAKPIEWLEANIMAALMFKQLRVFSKGKQPLAILTWAYASTAVSERLKFPQYNIALSDWRSGPDIVVVDCISPFTDSEKFKKIFLKEVEQIKSVAAKK